MDRYTSDTAPATFNQLLERVRAAHADAAARLKAGDLRPNVRQAPVHEVRHGLDATDMRVLPCGPVSAYRPRVEYTTRPATSDAIQEAVGKLAVPADVRREVARNMRLMVKFGGKK